MWVDEYAIYRVRDSWRGRRPYRRLGCLRRRATCVGTADWTSRVGDRTSNASVLEEPRGTHATAHPRTLGAGCVAGFVKRDRSVDQRHGSVGANRCSVRVHYLSRLAPSTLCHLVWVAPSRSTPQYSVSSSSLALPCTILRWPCLQQRSIGGWISNDCREHPLENVAAATGGWLRNCASRLVANHQCE